MTSDNFMPILSKPYDVMAGGKSTAGLPRWNADHSLRRIDAWTDPVRSDYLDQHMIRNNICSIPEPAQRRPRSIAASARMKCARTTITKCLADRKAAKPLKVGSTAPHAAMHG